MKKSELNKIKWIKHLEREHNILMLSVNALAYGPLLKNETGFSFDHQLYYYSKGRNIFYRQKKELNDSDLFFAGLIERKDPRIKLWMDKEEKIFKSLDKKIKNPIKAIEHFKSAFLFTVIPYRLFSSLTLKNDPSLEKKLEKARSRSIYPQSYIINILPLIKKIALQRKINQNLVGLMTIYELEDYFTNGKMPSLNELKTRKDCFVFLDDANNFNFFHGKIKTIKNEGICKELRGTIAFKGVARGNVCIINSVDQLKKFRKGDVLVSINTSPSIMTAIQKASAIISDEGGMLCHAAIVSRELKIPCIINTKHATKLLKDGDHIEVDAVNGIVRKLD